MALPVLKSYDWTFIWRLISNFIWRLISVCCSFWCQKCRTWVLWSSMADIGVPSWNDAWDTIWFHLVYGHLSPPHIHLLLRWRNPILVFLLLLFPVIQMSCSPHFIFELSDVYICFDGIELASSLSTPVFPHWPVVTSLTSLVNLHAWHGQSGVVILASNNSPYMLQKEWMVIVCS